jgi:Cas6b C-terminal domain/Cas6b N-terminal domain
MKTIKTLTLTFDIPLLPHQISMWRGAIAEHAGWEEEAFHNHAGAKERVHYRYPSVQYRSIDGKAALFVISEGVEAVQNMLLASDGVLNMGKRSHRLLIENFKHSDHPLSMWSPVDSMSADLKPYFLKNWLALNEHNFKEWDSMTSLVARTQKLEQILASNIISFAKGIPWQLPQRLEVTLLQLRSTHTVQHKGVPMVAFDVSFSANIHLPEGLGLGKACSHGFGVVMPLEVKKDVKKRPRLQRRLAEMG